MPFVGEHAARIVDPDKFEDFRRSNDRLGAGVDVIFGIRKKGEEGSEIQTIRFDAERFTVNQAKKWLDDHPEFKVILFEPAIAEEEQKESMREAVLPFKDLDLADRSREWDGDAARRRVREWAGGDEVDFDKYSQAFVVVDGPKENLTSYKLPFADIIDGKLMAVPRGIFAVAAVLQGARGGVDLPRGDLQRARGPIGRYYRKMELTPPWEQSESMSEAFHLRGTHWVPVPESGSCPTTHPNKLKFPDTDTLRCFTDSAARVVRTQMREQAAEKLTNERSNLRPAREDNPNERCALCAYFDKPTTCRIVEGPVAVDLVCDWIDSTGQDPELYEVSDEDWLSFVRGMIDKQPYQHIVKDGAITPAGPVVLIEDTAKPPHRFSLTRPFHIGHTVDSHHWTQAEVDDLVAVGKRTTEGEPSVKENLEEGIRPAFGSPGGKKYLAQKIVSLMPEHKKYVEAFVGGGAVLFAKKPSDQEVINDKHAGVAHAYRYIKAIDVRKVESLKKMPITFSRPQFFKIRDSAPSSDMGRFHRFLYLNAFSFGKSGNSTVKEENATFGPLTHRLDRMTRIAERLSKINILSEDFRSVIRRNDSPSTFFYLDPPYPDQQGKLKTSLTNEDIYQAVKGIKGKFLLSLPNTSGVRRVFSEFNKRAVLVRRTMEMRSEHYDTELLISNYPLKSSKMYLAESFTEEAAEIVLVEV